MIEIGPGADLFRMVGGIFWLIVIAAVLAAALIPKTKKGKAIAVAGVLGVLLLFPGRQIAESVQRENAAQTRRAEAERRFQEHCKKAGEFIYKTVDNVEGILVMKERSSKINFGDQFTMDDPYGFDVSGDGYIAHFLLDKDEKGSLVYSGVKRGYRYAEVIDSVDGKRYRYTGRIDQPWLHDKRYGEWVREFALDKTLATGPSLRYGVTYDDISTREDREYWIAGSSLRVIDLQTNEVIAERIGYMMDPGQGATGQGGSHPAWDRARRFACPAFPQTPDGHPFTGYQSRNFVESVIKPIQEK